MQVHTALRPFLLYLAFQQTHAVRCFFDCDQQHFFRDRWLRIKFALREQKVF